MSFLTGASVDSTEFAIHELALAAGHFPWELEEADPPADRFLRAVAFENAKSKGRVAARKREAELRAKAVRRA